MPLAGSTIRAALAAAGAVGKQLRSFDELAAGASTALRQAPPGLTPDGAAAFLATAAVESAWFRTTVEYGTGQRYAPYIGRTFVQLTWEANYRGFGQWCHARRLVDDPLVFVRDPTTLGAYEFAWLGAVYYFETTRLWEWANAGDFRRVSQAVNGGRGRAGTAFTPNGWSDRQAMYAVFRRAGAELLPTPARLGGAPAPVQEEDDMFSDNDRRILAEVHGQLLTRWPGWDGGTGEELTPVDYLRRNNVEVAQLHRNLNDAVHRKLDDLLAREPAEDVPLGSVVSVDGEALFTADQVRALIREALAEPLPLYLTTSKETS